MKRTRVHRRVFALAAIYNIAWGSFTALRPNWLFDYAHMPPSNHPEIFACLGMVIGVYGLLYAEVAHDPERGFAIAAVGLLGKILGPLGWVVLFVRGTWPLETYALCLSNDVIRWPAFALYVRDAWPLWRSGPREPWE